MMELSETQKLLVNGLKLFKVEKECIVGIMLMLKEEDQMWDMMDCMADNLKATQEELLLKATEIYNS